MENSYNDQIVAANKQAEKDFFDKENRLFYKNYKKFFKETVTLLEDNLIEQWENNEHNKTMSNAIEHIAHDIDRLTSKILPYFEQNQAGEAASTVVDATKSMALAVVDSVSNLPAIYNPDSQAEVLSEDLSASAREVYELEADYREDVVSIFKRIADDINYIADHYRLLNRNKVGKVGDPTQNNPDKGNLGITDLIAGFFSLKALKNLAGKLWKKINGRVAILFSGFFGKIGNIISEGFGFLLKRFPVLGKIFAPIAKLMAPVLKVFGKLGIRSIPIIGQVIAAIMAVWDFFSGFSDSGASELLGISKEKLTIFDKIKSGVVSLISGLLLGLFEKKTILNFVNKFNNTVKELWAGFVKIFGFNFKKIFQKVKNYLSTKVQTAFIKLKSMFSVDMLKQIGSSIFSAISNLFLNFTPIGLAIKNSDKIKEFAMIIYEKVKSIVEAILEFLTPDFLKENVKSLFSDSSQPQVENINKPIDTSTTAATTELEIQKTKTLNKKQEIPNVIVQQPAQKPQASVERSVSSGRDDLNRIIAGNKQFSFS